MKILIGDGGSHWTDPGDNGPFEVEVATEIDPDVVMADGSYFDFNGALDPAVNDPQQPGFWQNSFCVKTSTGFALKVPVWATWGRCPGRSADLNG